MSQPTKNTLAAYRKILLTLKSAKSLLGSANVDLDQFKQKLADLRSHYKELDGYSIARTALDQLPELLEKGMSSFNDATMRAEFASIIHLAAVYTERSIPIMEEATKSVLEKTLPHLLKKN